jgi:hypothetical protein
MDCDIISIRDISEGRWEEHGGKSNRMHNVLDLTSQAHSQGKFK